MRRAVRNEDIPVFNLTKDLVEHTRTVELKFSPVFTVTCRSAFVPTFNFAKLISLLLRPHWFRRGHKRSDSGVLPEGGTETELCVCLKA